MRRLLRRRIGILLTLLALVGAATVLQGCGPERHTIKDPR